MEEQSSVSERKHTINRDGHPRVSRRSVLAAGAALSATAVAGCLGENDTPSNTTTATSTPSEPSKPWTTDALADHIDPEAKVTVYAGTGDGQQWHDLITVINDEFGTALTANVFASDGQEVSQRIVQERQAGDDKWDVCSAASELTEKTRVEGDDVAKKYFEWDMDTNFWFKDVVDEKRLLPFVIGPFNGGASSVMCVNVDIFEERGLEYPTSYNDLFDDGYAGLKTVFPSFVVGKEMGWIVKFHADEADMDPVEWLEALKDHLDFVGADSYGPAIRSVAQGEAAIDFHNFPWFASSFVGKYDSLEGVFVDPVKEEAFGGDLVINNQAPNPWVARFIASAYFEESVQRRLITDVTDQVPARTDELDIESMDLDDYTKRRLTTPTDLLGFYELNEYSDVYAKIREAGVLKDL